MSAAPPGTVTLTCPTHGGTFTVTVTYDPHTGALAATTVTSDGHSATGTVTVHHANGSRHAFTIAAGAAIPGTRLAAAGITAWSDIAGITVAAT